MSVPPAPRSDPAWPVYLIVGMLALYTVLAGVAYWWYLDRQSYPWSAETEQLFLRACADERPSPSAAVCGCVFDELRGDVSEVEFFETQSNVNWIVAGGSPPRAVADALAECVPTPS